MEEIQIKDIVGNRDNWLEYAVIHCLGDKYTEVIPVDCKSIKIDLKFNGVEVKFETFIKMMKESFEDSIKKHALELLREKLDDFTSLISRLEVNLITQGEVVLGLPHKDW